MSTIKVMFPGLLTTIQDAGRFGYQQVGVCVTGVMDPYAHKVANILVGNPDKEEAVLEMTFMGPVLAFSDDALIAITGANLSPTLDGEPVSNWETIHVKAGSILRFGQIRSGARAYLAIAGGFDIPVVMGSKSTYTKAQIGGYQGRKLAPGDEIPYSSPKNSCPLYALPPECIPAYVQNNVLRVVLGPQEDYFTPEGIATFLNSDYTVSAEFDRMGYRLEGETIQHNDKGSDIISDGMVMGAIQVPGSGKPIILMADRQTAGGYTKIATVISADLPTVGQSKAGDSFRFEQVSIEQAQHIYVETERKLEAIEASLIAK